MFKLENKVSVTVPSKIGHEEVDNSLWIEYAMKRFATVFGGASSFEQNGAWMSDEDGLVIENNTVVYAFCDDIESGKSEAFEIARKIAVSMRQDAVMVEANGTAFFIEEASEAEAEENA